MTDETPEIEQTEEEPKRRRRKKKPASEAGPASEATAQESGSRSGRRKGTRVATEEEPAEPEAPVAGSSADVDPQAKGEQTETVVEASAVEEAEGAEEPEAAGQEPEAAEEEAEAAGRKPPAAVKESDAAEEEAKAVQGEAETAERELEPAEEEPKPPARRRGRRGADVPQPAPAPRRRRREQPRRDVVVRAQAKYVRTSARKARLVCDHIRGKSVEEARAILTHAPRAVARDWSKVLESAVANAEHNHELIAEDLYIKAVHADEGPTIKRYRPRALGRATRIRKRTSHLTILLTPKL
jgi:ribosomal protein L22